MNVPGWALALLLASWLLWGAMCWVTGYTSGCADTRHRSPRTKSDE